MPRKPTIHTRAARKGLLSMIKELPEKGQLPTLSDLGQKYGVHPSTIFRILRDLAEEGIVWQSPQGKFFAASARRKTLKGTPLCFVGREMWLWSRLYQELLEGIAEVCSANGSPLVLSTCASLVRQDSPSSSPSFASERTQVKDLQRLLSSTPRGCAGFLFDHLWTPAALGSVKYPGGGRLQLLGGDGVHAEVFAPDYQAGAALVADFLARQGLHSIGLVVPFEGDPVIDLTGHLLRRSLAGFSVTEIPFKQRAAGSLDKLEKFDALVCFEDNVAETLARENIHSLPLLIATQGTGVIHSPHVRLRIDYRRLGRAAASRILHGTTHSVLSPLLIVPQDE